MYNNNHLQVILDVDEGPELGAEAGGKLGARLLVKPIRDVFCNPIKIH